MTERTHHGGCTNPCCACNDTRRWPICAEFQAPNAKTEFCLRCGWNRAHHEYLALVGAAIVDLGGSKA